MAVFVGFGAGAESQVAFPIDDDKARGGKHPAFVFFYPAVQGTRNFPYEGTIGQITPEEAGVGGAAVGVIVGGEQ